MKTIERNCSRRVRLSSSLPSFLSFLFLFLFYITLAPARQLWSTNVRPHNGNKAPNKRFPSRWTERTGKSDISMPSCPPSSCFFPLLPSPSHNLFLARKASASFYGPSFFPVSLISFSTLASIAYFDAPRTPLRVRASIEIAP